MRGRVAVNERHKTVLPRRLPLAMGARREKHGANPDLAFRMAGMPPRKTLQGGRGLAADPDAPGGVRVFTKGPQRMEAAWMRGEFARRLPKGWTPRTDPARVRVELVYPARKRDKTEGEILIPHTARPDADNLVKSLLDALTRAGVWADDAQVWDLRVRKWRGARPRWAVFVWFESPTPFPAAAGEQGALPGIRL